MSRLMERRALRRAADQALLTSLVTASARPAGSALEEPTTEPIPVDNFETSPEPAEPPAPAAAEAAYALPSHGFAMARVRKQPWYRAKPTVGALVAGIVVAVALGGWLVFRSRATTAEQSTTEVPTSVLPPAPSKSPPPAGTAPKRAATPPPPTSSPPPPPASSRPTNSAPQRQYSPRYIDSSPTQKPRVDVTRAPMSVAPVPKPVAGSESNIPGDAPDKEGGSRRSGCFGFC
ncbi:hypothetical protein A5651_17890 [Mycobacterium sp. 1274761.0]|nr:hypothetical protein A5651_17890 [Mycobacterium sp. 1274761.0]